MQSKPHTLNPKLLTLNASPMSSTTEKIKERLSIEEVVGTYLKLERSGKNLRAKCPFHNEKTPSFFVSPDRGTYYCFGCSAKGDIFTFIEEYEGLDFRGALKLLADRAGVEIEPPDPKKENAREKLFQILEDSTLFFEENLRDRKDALKYLKDRGLREETVSEFRLGYAPDSWQALTNLLKGKGHSERDAIRAGVVLKKEGGKRAYDRFRGRIVFPIFDASGRVIAFSGRIFPEKEDDKGAKYINSPENPLFHKSKTLYGYHVAKNHIRKNNFAILVEGQMDLLMSHQAGYKNSIAASGTSATVSHFETIKRHTDNVVLALDSDAAGELSVERSAKEALALGMDVKVSKLPKDSDPADVISKNPEDWKSLIKGSLHVIDFQIEVIKENEDDERKRKKMISAKVLPMISLIPDKIDQAHFVKRVSEETDVSEDMIYEELSKIKSGDSERSQGSDQGSEASGRPSQSQSETPRSRHFLAERIESILVWQEDAEEKAIDVKKQRERFSQLLSEKSVKLKNREKEDRLFEAEALFKDTEKLSERLEDLFSLLEEDVLKERMEKLVSQMKSLEKEKGESESSKLLEEYQDLLVKLAKLKSN